MLCQFLVPLFLLVESGPASWYGPGFHQKLTASGTIYDQYDSNIAAHPTLPFGTTILVHNPANQKTTQVQIVDRGPYFGNRIVDLSLAAYQEIDDLTNGITEVILYITKPEYPILSNLIQKYCLTLP